MRRLGPGLAAALLCLGGCGGSGEEDGPPAAPTSTAQGSTTAETTTTMTETEAETETEAAVELVPIPRDAGRKCRSSQLLRPACPELAPEAPYDEIPEVYEARRLPGGGGAETFNLQWGAETPGRPARNRPPRLSHVVVAGGPLRTSLRGIEGRPLRRVVWSGRRGTLLRAAPYPRGGIHGNHLVFRWREGETEYALSLHAWKPPGETVATLEAIVASLPRP